jgi:hypothetical protein
MKRVWILLVSSIMLSAGMTGPAQAMSPIEWKIDYYSDYEGGNLVGEQIQYCDGSGSGFGYPTAYSLYYYNGC